MAHFDYVAARDAMSKRLLEELGVADVHIMPDVVLSLPDDGREVDLARKKELKTIGLILATHNQTVKDNFDRVYPFLLELSEAAAHKGYKIVCIPFQIDKNSSRGKAVDETIPARKLQQDFRQGRVNFEVIVKLMSATETLAYIKHNISVVLSMRLHGNVMAAAAGVPFISLSYNDKHAGFVEMMEMQDYDIPLDSDILNVDSVVGLVQLIERDYDRIVCHIKARTDQLRMQTREQIEVIRQKYFA